MVKNQYQYHLPENFDRPNFRTIGQRSYRFPGRNVSNANSCSVCSNLSLITVSGLRERTELVCAHGKRDPGIKFTGVEFCLPFAQTVN